MSEDLTLIQRIKSASDIDVRTHGFIYELADKDGRWTFLHRDVDGVFKPNFTKRLFYYINTSEFDLPLSFKEVPYKAEKIDAEVIFRLQLCPTADFDKDPELANWVASERLDVLRASDVKSRLAGRLGAYFSRIVNGATSLALAEQYGKGAFRDDYSAWNDSGLPSWLYIAKTASADVTRLPTEAEREVQLENERVARAMERTRKVKEQIDIAVSEAKLKEAQDAIAHHMEQLRQRRELENAQYALMLQQVETARERDLRAREIEELEHQIAKDSRRVDLAIKYEDLKAAQAKTQHLLVEIENSRKESEAKISRINQEIEESKARIRAIIIGASIWRKILLIVVSLLGIGVVVVVGVLLFQEKQKKLDHTRIEIEAKMREETRKRELEAEKAKRIELEKLRKDVQIMANEFDARFLGIKVKFAAADWRGWQLKLVESKIGDLKDKLRQDFGKGECDELCKTIQDMIDQLNAIDDAQLLEERQAILQLDKVRMDVAELLKVWPVALPERSRLEKLKADLSAEFLNVNSNAVDVSRIQQMSTRLEAFLRKKKCYKEDIKVAIKRAFSQPLNYYPIMITLIQGWEAKTYSSDAEYLDDMVVGMNYLDSVKQFSKFDYSIKRLDEIERDVEALGEKTLHTAKNIPLPIFVAAQTNRFVAFFAKGENVSQIVNETSSACQTAELSLKLIRDSKSDLANEIDTMRRNKEWEKLVEYCTSKINNHYGSDGAERFEKLRKEAKFHIASTNASAVCKKFKQTCPRAYAVMWDYKDDQGKVKDLISNDMKVDISSVVRALPNLDGLCCIEGIDSLAQEGFDLVFLAEIMYYTNDRAADDVVRFYEKFKFIGNISFRLAKIDRHALYNGVGVHGNDDERKHYRIEALIRARENGCSVDTKKPLIIERGF